MGQSIVAAAGLVDEADWIYHHHEHVDGSGYPDGLAGDEIPLESRVIHVADAFEAMTANRPYNPARLPVEAFAELERGVGTQFDRDLRRRAPRRARPRHRLRLALVRPGRARRAETRRPRSLKLRRSEAEVRMSQ